MNNKKCVEKLKERKYRDNQKRLFEEGLKQQLKRGVTNGLHQAFFNLCGYAKSAGLSKEHTVSAIEAVADGYNKGEVADTFDRAADNYDPNYKKSGIHTQPTVKKTRQERLTENSLKGKAFVERNTKGASYSEEDIYSLSPVSVKDLKPAEMREAHLSAFFKKDDICFCGTNPYDSGTDFIKPREQQNTEHSHFISNSLSGKIRFHEKSESMKVQRGDADCTGHYCVVIEHDDMNKSLQLSFAYLLIKMGFSVASVTDSAGKSIHIILKIQIKDYQQWCEYIKDVLFDKFLLPLGFDGACSNPARLTRLAGHLRTKSNQIQKLLYLNDNVEVMPFEQLVALFKKLKDTGTNKQSSPSRAPVKMTADKVKRLAEAVKRGGDIGQAAVEEWLPIDLGEDFKKIPPFPINSLPSIVRDMAIETKETVKVQTEVSALSVMTTIASCFGNRVYTDICGEVKSRTNKYSIIFLARGERKSAIYNKTIKPVYEWIKTQLPEYKRYRKKLNYNKKKLEILEGKLLKSVSENPELKADFQKLEYEVENEPRVANPNFLAENTTSEATIKLLRVADGKMALFSDDARDAIQILMGVYSEGFSKEHIYTKIYDGFHPLTNHRAKDTDFEVICTNPCANLLLMTQTDVIEMLSKVESFFAGGFVSRIDFCYPDSLVGKRYSDGSLVRPFDRRRMSPEINQRYRDLVFKLLDKYYYNQEEINVPVTPEAEQIWIDFYHNIESESHDDGLFGGGKLDFGVRIGQKVLEYSLNFALIEGETEISAKHMRWGIDIALYYYQHAEKVFNAISKKVLSKDCRKVLSQISKHLGNVFTSTNIMYHCHLKKEQTEKAVEELISKNYIRELATVPIQGRKPLAQQYEVNPQFFILQKGGKK